MRLAGPADAHPAPEDRDGHDRQRSSVGEAARDRASEIVRAWLDDLLDPNLERAARTPAQAPATPPLRPLGATGQEVPALIVSGAGMLHPREYAAAMHAGCNYFFWEPRYHGLGRMLARSPMLAARMLWAHLN